MKAEPKKVLIIRLSSIGDILLSTPFLRVLHQRFPKTQIDFILKKQYLDLLRTNPYLYNIFAYDTNSGWKGLKHIKRQINRQHYDLIIDIHKNFRSIWLRQVKNADVVTHRKYVFKRFLLVKLGLNYYKETIPVYKRYINSMAYFGVRDDGNGLEFYLDQHENKKIQHVLNHKGYKKDKRTICIAPGAGFVTKRWLPEYYTVLAQKLIDECDVQILLLGDHHDRPVTNQIEQGVTGPVINLAGELTLMESACALNAGKLVVTNDTGLMHLATALKKKTVAIFGPTVRELGFFPYGKQSIVIENRSLKCRPCTHIGRDRCPAKHFKCMKDIEPDYVYAVIEKMLTNDPSENV